MSIKTISVLGLGYIGLPTATILSDHFKVFGYDPIKEKIEKIKNGTLEIDEPGLKEILDKAIEEGKIEVSDRIHEADMYIICVGTPFNEDKSCDLKYIKDACHDVLKVLKKGDTVVLESTSPPRTTEDVVKPILEKSGLKVSEDIYLAHSPERVIPGNILYELKNNHRVVGGVDKKSAEIVRDVYKTFVDAEVFTTDATTAEVCKLLENTFRDVNIALANEMLKICDTLGVNVWELIELANKHPRVNVHTPGPGVGGHCISVDPWFLVTADKENSKLIHQARDINDSMPKFTADKIKKIVEKGSKIAILGSSFKPNIDDFRESPITHLIALLKDDYNVAVYDPFKNDQILEFNELYGDIREVITGADLLVLGVNHSQFQLLDYKEIKKVMNKKNIFDTRNFIDREKVEELGFNYYLLGSGELE